MRTAPESKISSSESSESVLISNQDEELDDFDYIFGEEGVTCRDRHEEERWFIACREIEAVSVLRLQGGRFYLYLIERESGRQLAVHSHASISQEVGALALVQSTFGERSEGPPPESDH